MTSPPAPNLLEYPGSREAGGGPVAALFVAKGGCYFGLPGVDPWDIERDARLYSGPWPVVAHPPCERWGRYWGGAPKTWPRKIKGDDNGCFAAALASVRRFGGVIEHPEGSHAWRHFGLNTPPKNGGWVVADWEGGWTCCVEQGAYGHRARKATWLYACGVDTPSLRWGRAAGDFLRFEDGFHSAAERAQARAKATKRGIIERLSHSARAATPIEFRDVLLSIARSSRILGFGPHAEISAVDANPGRSVSSLAGRGFSSLDLCSVEALRTGFFVPPHEIEFTEGHPK